MSGRLLGSLFGVAFALGTAGAVLLATEPAPPKVVEDIEAADTATARAQAASARLAEALEAIAANLEAGRGLAARSEDIQALTERQRASLQDVAGILAEQLGSLKRSQRILQRTEATTDLIAELSAEQVAALRRSVAALRRLEEAAGDSGRFSAEVARQALYAARLAEDSEEAFRDP